MEREYIRVEQDVTDENINPLEKKDSSLGNTDNSAYYVAFGLILIPGVLFLVFVSPILWQKVSSFLVLGFLYVFVGDLVYLWLCHNIDPGIIPKKKGANLVTKDPEVEQKNENKETYKDKEIYVNGIKTKVRWCQTCNIWRPPRASHCHDCNQCVENFDHHCPWVANCVAKRNYRIFLIFLFMTTLLCLYTFGCCLVTLIVLSFESDPNSKSIVFDAMMKSPVSAILLLYTFVVVWSVGGLGCFHTYLVCTGKSTHEEFTARKNPFFHGTINNCLITCCPASTPSYVRSNRGCLV